MQSKQLKAWALATTLLSGAGLSAPAFAQDADAEEAGSPTDVIQVTGSRVRNANLIATSPVTQVDAAEFTLSGTTRVEDLLRTLPQVTPSLDSFSVNPSTGTASVDLRGLGTNRTLVLVNGRRLQSGGIRTQAPDLNQIPSALVERVEILTGGASSVYGADAVAGVVNFIVNRDFEGIEINAGISGYQHNNRNAYMQGLQQAAGFEFPDGASDIDGRAYDIDMTMGSSFADGRGSASGYITYRKNEELFQGDRDYSNCALNAAGTACGGSSTAPIANFLASGNTTNGALSSDFISFDETGTWRAALGQIYNFAPVNFYQRPDERWTFGAFFNYEVNPMFRPYLDFSFANTNTDVQIAESGTFFTDTLGFECNDPLINSLCTDIGVIPNPNGADISLSVGKRNVEGGGRVSSIDSSAWRWTAGTEGDLGGSWSYDASFSFASTSSSEITQNDFLRTRTRDALLGCPTGAFAGCIPYNPFVPNGVTPEAAAGLAGTGVLTGRTELITANSYVTGDIPVSLPTATSPVSVVAGAEYRRESYRTIADTNIQTGNFTGRGGQTPPIGGEYNVWELFGEAFVPLLQDAPFADELVLELGYRYSNYNTSGGASTYKTLLSWTPNDIVRVRGGYNRAIRAANVSELFQPTAGGLWGGEDPCATTTPLFTAAQCALTGVSAAQYGNINASPASQYNQITGGNPGLDPESADTWTFGVVLTPLSNVSLTVDYYDITIADRIGAVGASNIVRGCGLTGDPGLCSLISRNAGSGDLWSGTAGEPGNGVVRNLTSNFGNLVWRGVDFNLAWAGELPRVGGNLSAVFNGSIALEQTVDPLPGVNDAAKYDCAGVINPACSTSDWRHTARVSYDVGSWWSASLRWRYFSEMDYTLQNGTAGATDRILVNNGNTLDAISYFDVTGQFDVRENASLTLGVNNILDEEPPLVGAGLADNANSLTGYDQAGRYLFGRISLQY
ncbi:TonB-dependent receptor domain-containing protein [Maricaulaceae bacterium MS644]